MIEVPQKLLDQEVMQHAAIVAIQTPRIVEIVSVLIEKAEKGRQEEQAFDGATENFLAQLKTILYGLSLRSESLSDSLYKAGYKDQLEIAEQCGWVV
ncbi:hypothetical protein [Commensalibacter communis]|uniref:hypothetical protein n=1 Tax=Commensalibacter communis TaxID=2972786 RepID=UPI0022FFA6A8|nr:hypothetical protein [Commensalibacter communis]CAI3960652.1 unnamed protein product [Commensalibacter communis]CAI3960854.1 unnamed protein product [Commensalibacter communis]